MIRAVLFDVDDTLVDYSGAERAGIARHLCDLGVPAGTVPAGVSYWHLLMECHFTRYLDGELSFQEHRRERVRDMLRWLGRSAPSTVASASRIRPSSWPAVRRSGSPRRTPHTSATTSTTTPEARGALAFSECG